MSDAIQKRRLIAQQREADFERWQAERLATDPRLGALRAMRHDIRHHGEIGEMAWRRFRNEKYSRVAEGMTATHHERPDYYAFDPETRDVIISESDGIRPRYTFRDMYTGGLQKSRELAEQKPQFAFQQRRDEIFLQFYEQVEAMLAGETDFDHIQLVSTFPVDELVDNLEAVEAKHYDTSYGKQFKYDVWTVHNPDGSVTLGMFTSTLHCPPSDLQPGGTAHGKAALAALQRHNGASAPFEMLSSHEQNACMTTSMLASHDTEDLMELFAADVRYYDAALNGLDGQIYDHGRLDVSIEAYELFGHSKNDWATYDSFYESLARHLEGEPLDPELQAYLINLMRGYQSVDKINSSLSEAEFELLLDSLGRGDIPARFELACNELLDYAHSALMWRYLCVYKETGCLPGEREGEEGSSGYASDASDASTTAASLGMDFDDCEGTNGVSPTQAAADLAARTGISFAEAINRVNRSRERAMAGDLQCVKCPLPGCGKTVDAERVSHKGKRGIFCPACKRIALSNGDIVSASQDETSDQASRQQLRAGHVLTLAGRRLRLEERVVVGGTTKVVTDVATGEQVADSWAMAKR